MVHSDRFGTYNPRFRRPMLYPVELRVHLAGQNVTERGLGCKALPLCFNVFVWAFSSHHTRSGLAYENRRVGSPLIPNGQSDHKRLWLSAPKKTRAKIMIKVEMEVFIEHCKGLVEGAVCSNSKAFICFTETQIFTHTVEYHNSVMYGEPQ